MRVALNNSQLANTVIKYLIQFAVNLISWILSRCCFNKGSV